MDRRPCAVYLGLPSLPLERHNELEAAATRNLDVVFVTHQAGVEPRPPMCEIIEIEAGDPIRACDVIRIRLSALARRPVCVIPWLDRHCELAARLAEALGLPGPSVVSARLARDKTATRRRLDALDGANPAYAVLDDPSAFTRAFTTLGPPCVLKPAGASSGRGVFMIDTPEQAQDVHREFRALCEASGDPIYTTCSGRALLERRLRGSEHSAAGLISEGCVHLYGLTDKRTLPDLPYTFQTVFPSCLPEASQQPMLELARDAVLTLGLDDCGFHVDMMLTAEGPRVLEVGGRRGGECIHTHLIPVATDLPRSYEALFTTLMDSSPMGPIELEPRRRAVFRHVLPPRPGRVLSLEGVAELERRPEVHALCRLAEVGDSLVPPPTRYAAFAVAAFVASCPLEVDVDTFSDTLAASVRVSVA